MPDGPSSSSSQSGSQMIERKLATILSADVAEFSRLMGEDEEQTLRTFRGHKKVFESLVEMHRGRIFNTAGDAILAEFSSAVEAVRCATDVQSALRTRNDQLPPTRQVRFRIGINLGDVMIQGHDLLGDGVNVAARLQTAAEPGGVCISGSVHDQISNKLSLSFLALGERNYKNIPQPVRTFSIVEAEGGGTLPGRKASTSWKKPAAWITAGLLIVAGVGYAAYVVHQRGESEKAAAMAASVQSQPAPVQTPVPAAANPTVDKPASPPPQPSVGSTGSAMTASPAVNAKPAAKPTGSAQPRAPGAGSQPKVSSAAAASNVAKGQYDGAYSGQVCYGKTRALPQRCYQAGSAIHGNKITGKWQMPNEPEVTMTLVGDVTPSGDVTISIHGDRDDGGHATTINLTGTVHAGILEASGKFLKGRSANLTWRLNEGATH